MSNSILPARFFLVFFMSLSIFAQATKARGQEKKTPTLSSLQFEFDIQRAELMKPTRDLQKKYEVQLNQLFDQVTQAGHLDKAVVVKAELAGFKEGKSKPTDGKFPELKRLQEIYSITYAKRITLMNEKLGSVLKGYKVNLLALQTQLTKGKKLEEALIVKAEIAKVDELAKTNLNRTPLSAVEPKAKPEAAFRVGSQAAVLTTDAGESKLAVVKIDGVKWGILKEGAVSFSDAAYVWEKVPVGMENTRFTLNGKHSHTLKFDVEQPGLVFIATSPRFPENSGSGDSWEKDTLDVKALRRAGWRIVREFEGLSNTDSGAWMVFYKECAAGESHSIRTEKYSAPVLLTK